MHSWQVLIDSSVWIRYLRDGGIPELDRLITDDLVCTNELILTELVPFLRHQKEDAVADILLDLPRVELQTNWESIRAYQQMNRENGINKVGIPDLIILEQVISHKLTLFTFDKHFRLMRDLVTFEVFEWGSDEL